MGLLQFCSWPSVIKFFLRNTFQCLRGITQPRCDPILATNVLAGRVVTNSLLVVITASAPYCRQKISRWSSSPLLACDEVNLNNIHARIVKGWFMLWRCQELSLLIFRFFWFDLLFSLRVLYKINEIGCLWINVLSMVRMVFPLSCVGSWNFCHYLLILCFSGWVWRSRSISWFSRKFSQFLVERICVTVYDFAKAMYHSSILSIFKLLMHSGFTCNGRYISTDKTFIEIASMEIISRLKTKSSDNGFVIIGFICILL